MRKFYQKHMQLFNSMNQARDFFKDLNFIMFSLYTILST